MHGGPHIFIEKLHLLVSHEIMSYLETKASHDNVSVRCYGKYSSSKLTAAADAGAEGLDVISF